MLLLLLISAGAPVAGVSQATTASPAVSAGVGPTKCDFALWDRPSAKPCPQCHAPFLVEKYSKQTGTSLVCRNDECGYKE